MQDCLLTFLHLKCWPKKLGTRTMLSFKKQNPVREIVKLLCFCETDVGGRSQMSLFIYFCIFFWRVRMAYGSSQARGQFRAVAASLHHMGSKPRLRPTPELTATLDP